jgi:hypothetical protein
MAVFKWLGFALVAVALVLLPIAMWVSAWWGFVAGAVGLVGLGLLAIHSLST